MDGWGSGRQRRANRSVSAALSLCGPKRSLALCRRECVEMPGASGGSQVELIDVCPISNSTRTLGTRPGNDFKFKSFLLG
jgi:hypothetical protein